MLHLNLNSVPDLTNNLIINFYLFVFQVGICSFSGCEDTILNLDTRIKASSTKCRIVPVTL